MVKYKNIREVVIRVLSDQKWHTIDEIENMCEAEGMKFDKVRGPIYNVLHQLKKSGVIESDGTGAYRKYGENIVFKAKKGDKARTVKFDEELNNCIKRIETQLIKLKKFDWINCTETELQEARFSANNLIKLSEKIQSELL